ncbi:hypothetical protein BUALT_Bualt06G0076500 [Buddleja alternifolia]|uniref:Dirigent protein n=1 Tax=Buddleja alternifolia TaxID=168488 RepID=A0AAV6XK83_9LAMI|nr:hypothetical protein BUALT_Bualt06G0076500 [Buddleja alternifolia]
MGKVCLLFMFYSLAIAMARPYSNINNVISMTSSYPGAEQPNPIEEWFQTLDQAEQKVIKLHFYVQDVVSGEKSTVWKVAESKISSSSPSSFGLVYMADNLLTAGPEASSEIVGRAQGIVGFSDLHDEALYMDVSIVFTEGKYKGSTISILGRNPLYEKERELPIVGGSGVFRMARGVAVTNTVASFDESKSYEVLEYILYISYFEL